MNTRGAQPATFGAMWTIPRPPTGVASSVMNPGVADRRAPSGPREHARVADVARVPAPSWTCAYCERDTSSDRGWPMVQPGPSGDVLVGAIVICPRCALPTFIADDYQTPPVPHGRAVPDLPDESGFCTTRPGGRCQSGHSAASMAGRKVLMNVTTSHGADGGLGFVAYVDWLVDNGYVTPPMRPWVDGIRQLGTTRTTTSS